MHLFKSYFLVDSMMYLVLFILHFPLLFEHVEATQFDKGIWSMAFQIAQKLISVKLWLNMHQLDFLKMQVIWYLKLQI